MFVKLGQVAVDPHRPALARTRSRSSRCSRTTCARAAATPIAELLEEELDAPLDEVFAALRLAAAGGGVDRPGVPGRSCPTARRSS